MKPEELQLPHPKAAEMQTVAIDLSYETDPPEIMAILPRDAWAVFVRKTFAFQAKRSALQSQIYSARAEMLEAKGELIGKYMK
jgi:hypothetical protein